MLTELFDNDDFFWPSCLEYVEYIYEFQEEIYHW